MKMQTEIKTQPAIKTTYVDRPEVNELYADQVKRVTFHEGVVYIEFVVTRMDENEPPNEQTATQYTSARLALAPACGMQLRDQLSGLLTLLEQKGIVKKLTLVPPQPQGQAH